MDSMPPLDEQIRNGQKLIEQLNREGILVPAAAWVKECERWQWYLYLVTSLVGQDGATKRAYQRVTAVVRRLQGEGVWIDPFQLKVISPTDPAGEAIIAVGRQYRGGQVTAYGGASLGRLSIDGAYVYPPLPAGAV